MVSLPVLITAGLVFVIAVLTAGLWARNRGIRTPMIGLGLILIPVGMFLTELTQLSINGVMSLVAWAQRTPWSSKFTWGFSLLGVAALLLLIAGAMKPQAPRPKPPKPQATPPAGNPAMGAPTPATKPQDTPDEDAEIEAILRKRGIM